MNNVTYSVGVISAKCGTFQPVKSLRDAVRLILRLMRDKYTNSETEPVWITIRPVYEVNGERKAQPNPLMPEM